MWTTPPALAQRYGIQPHLDELALAE